MSFKFIGWCNEDGHDKIWAIIYINETNYATIWGRRGKKLSSKVFTCKKYEINWDMNKKIAEKFKKGYVEIDQKKLDEVYPGFEDDVKMMAFLAICEA